VVVFLVGVVEPKIVADNVGDLTADTNVTLPLPLVLERRFGVRSVSNAQVGTRAVFEVALIEGIQRTSAHPGFPEYREDDVTQTGILVLFEVVQYLRCFVSGKNIVGYLVFGVRLWDSH